MKRLKGRHWKNKDKAKDKGWFATEKDGEKKTRVVNGACIFHNPPGFEGGTGCAFHIAALEAGERPMDWKPDVCWQVPIRLEEHIEDGGYVVSTIREWKRRDWGKDTDGNPLKRRIAQLSVFDGVGRTEVESISAGDLFVLAGIPEVEVGDTISAISVTTPLPRLEVDEPVIRMAFGVNTSPYAGREGKFVTSRQLRDRLQREILGNVSIKIADTDSPDVTSVAGRGELQLAVLIENMRREGFELQVGRPEVITKEINGKRHEPLEAGTCDVPDEHVGTITQGLAPRKGRVTDLRPGDPGRTIVSFEAPSRGLIGFRSMLMSSTRGTALLHQTHAGWTPWVGELPHRLGGAMIADRIGSTTGYALDNLQLRGELFVAPGVEVYEGMIIGEAARGDEMVVNAVRAKEKTNIRTHSHDDGPKLATPVDHTLETAIEWIGDDELVEVTPKSIRIRKRGLSIEERRKSSKKG